MNQEVVDYLSQNKEKYSKEILIEELRKAGHSDASISEATAFVYGAGVESCPASNLAVPRPESELRYAGFWIRFLAVVIDGFVLIIPSVFIGIFFNAMNMEMFSGLFQTVLSWGYAIYMINTYQATIGKRIVGIKVITAEGVRLSLNQIIIRETVGKIISAIVLMVGYVMAAFTEKKEALHDKIAKTYVVYK